MHNCEIYPYKPYHIQEVPPKSLPKVPTSWDGLEKILPDLIERSGINTDLAIEFGVWHGYSTAALANNFKRVIGVDTFIGDVIPGTEKQPMFVTTSETLKPWPNIELVQARFQDYFRNCTERPDLIHIDIVHTYEDTYACGILALNICDTVIFHDTESFPEVKRALCDLVRLHGDGLPFRNYYECFGLGILTWRHVR